MQSLVDAIVVLVSTLRDHRGCGDVRGFDIIFIADESLRVKSEGIAHEFGDSVKCD